MEKLDWQKIAKLFVAFALANIIYDYFARDIFDIYKTIGIPFIALVLMFVVDRKRLQKTEE